jgi:hypothetical protein
MRRREAKISFTLVCAAALVLPVLVGCGLSSRTDSAASEPTATSQLAQVTTADSPTATEPVDSVTDDIEDHADAEAEVLENSGPIAIALNGESIAVAGEGATVTGSTVTITSPGTYKLIGSLTDGQIIVDVQDGVVGLELSSVDINSSTGPAIHIINAQEAVIVLADNTENHMSDGSARESESIEDEPTAALFSMADLTITGNGALEVEGNYQDGITSKDGLLFAGGTITIRAEDDGIRGKDYLIVQGGAIAVDAGGDGLKSDNEVDATQGYVRIEDGQLDITAGGDAIQAQTNVTVIDGEISLSSGGGSNSRIDESASAKGIKGVASVRIDGGSLAINSADDAIHSNGSIVVSGGTLVLSTGDDGMHADSTLDVNDGDITITESYEGLESAVITINDGEISIVSSDDGINVSGGNDGSGMDRGPGFGGNRGAPPTGGQDRWPGQDNFGEGGNQYLYIHGGYIVVNARGDGIDVNGSTEMTGGTVIVNGPTEQMNGALDSGSFSISGGFLVAAGSSGMAESPDESSTQYSVLLNFGATIRAGTLIHIQSTEGEQVLTFAPAKQYETIVLSSPALKSTTYDVYLGGSSTGSARDGLYQGGTTSSGTDVGSFTISGIVTWVGGRNRR